MHLFVAALLAAQLTRSPGPTTPPVVNLDAMGECVGGNGRIDLHRVMFLENRTLVVDGGTGPLRLRLEDETFYSEEIGERSERRTYINQIDAMVQPGENLDIELKFALVNNRLVLYWRETYQHRFYRQGLLTIEGRPLFGGDDQVMTPLCAGRGGSYSVM